MKKRVLLFAVLLLILAIPFVHAQDASKDASPDANKAITDAKAESKNAASEAAKFTEEFFGKEIQIPDFFLFNLLFGLEGAVNFKMLVIILVSWIMLFLLFTSIINTFTSKKLLGYLIAFVLVSAIAYMKFLVAFGNFMLIFVGGLFKVVSKESVIPFVLVIFAIIVAYFILFKILKLIKTKSGLTEAEMQGMQVGEGGRFLKKISEHI